MVNVGVYTINGSYGVNKVVQSFGGLSTSAYTIVGLMRLREIPMATK